jgi:hypothetical protein
MLERPPASVKAQVQDVKVTGEQKECATLKARIEAAIVSARAQSEELLSRANNFDELAKMLDAMLPYADVAGAESAILRLLPLPPPETVATAPALARRSVRPMSFPRITADVVWDHLGGLPPTFTVSNVTAKIIRSIGTAGSDQDVARLRNTVYTRINELCLAGKLTKVSQGVGKIQSVWRVTSSMT